MKTVLVTSIASEAPKVSLGDRNSRSCCYLIPGSQFNLSTLIRRGLKDSWANLLNLSDKLEFALRFTGSHTP